MFRFTRTHGEVLSRLVHGDHVETTRWRKG